MCGILGMVTDGKGYQSKYSLLKHLFVESSIRGVDATGMAGYCGHDFVIKHPVPSPVFVKGKGFKNLAGLKPSLIIGHTRAGTHGDKENNKNNHPFTIGDLSLIHNGVIQNYHELKAKYKFDLKGMCDSEILLHIIASKKKMVDGIKELYEQVDGNFAIAIYNSKTKAIYLFRNAGSPIFLVHSKTRNMICFASTKLIIDRACDSAFYYNSFDRVFNGKSEAVEAKTLVKLFLDKGGNASIKTFKLAVKEKEKYPVHNYERYNGGCGRGSYLTTSGNVSKDVWYERTGVIYYNPMTNEKYLYDSQAKKLYILPVETTRIVQEKAIVGDTIDEVESNLDKECLDAMNRDIPDTEIPF